MVLAMGAPYLQNRNVSLEEFCEKYSMLIEDMIEDSNNHKCPKIAANYDDYQNETIRPLNSTLFYLFYSGDRYRRFMAQWLMGAARYPNEKYRRAYMNFFTSR